MIDAAVTRLDIPPGMVGPEPLSIDVRCFVIVGASGVVLVDAGPPGTAEVIGATLERAGARWSDISDIVLTHRHFDHVGGLAEVVERASSAVVWAGVDDAPEIAVSEGRVVLGLAEEDRVRDLRVFHTPGHTPGHISLLHEAMSALILGDLVGSQDGALIFGPPAFTADADRSRASLQRMVDLRPERILFAHGAEIADPNSEVRALLAST